MEFFRREPTRSSVTASSRVLIEIARSISSHAILGVGHAAVPRIVARRARSTEGCLEDSSRDWHVQLAAALDLARDDASLCARTVRSRASANTV